MNDFSSSSSIRQLFVLFALLCCHLFVLCPSVNNRNEAKVFWKTNLTWQEHLPRFKPDDRIEILNVQTNSESHYFNMSLKKHPINVPILRSIRRCIIEQSRHIMNVFDCHEEVTKEEPITVNATHSTHGGRSYYRNGEGKKEKRLLCKKTVA